jgi:hypothetical protein
MPLECAAPALKSIDSAVQNKRPGWDLDPQIRLAMLAHEGCVLIKLLLRLLHCREKRDWTFVAFDMSQDQLMWFAQAVAGLEIKPEK